MCFEVNIMRKIKESFVKVTIFILTVAVLFPAFLGITATPVLADSGNGINRVINVVFDDSGSMYYDDFSITSLKRWSQALYSLEVFAAMLGPNDTMNVYMMSDFSPYSSTDLSESAIAALSGPNFVLHGSSSSETNIQTIHRFTSYSNGTPFTTVRKALYDLEHTSADDKWLVVLTDGTFQENGGDYLEQSRVDQYIQDKSDDVKVCCLALADGTLNLPTQVESQNIFSSEANSGHEILVKITDIISRVFNLNKLQINNDAVSFNLPMSELIVFAQGSNVNIGNITDSSGGNYSGQQVDVSYRAESNSTRYPEAPTDDTLRGCVSVCRGDFVPGTYNIDVSGADTVEVFYKPNIDILITAEDQNGNVYIADSSVPSGQYTITYTLVKGGTTEPIEDTSLIDPINYTATIDGNTFQNGDTVQLEEGDHAIVVEGRYLEINRITAEVNLTCNLTAVPVTFEVSSSDPYEIGADSVDTSNPITVHAKIDGREFTPEEWAAMGIPEVTLTKNASKYKLVNPSIVKTDDVGYFEVYFEVKGAPADALYTEALFQLSYSEQCVEGELWEGSFEGTIEFDDERSWYDRYKDKILLAIIIAVILLIILMYMPFVKHYLPKMKKYPTIEIENRALFKNSTSKGSVKKDILTTILPLVPQTGTITYIPKTSAVPKTAPLRVRAVGNGRMIITNQSVFEQKGCPVSFSGRSLIKDEFDEEGTPNRKRKPKPYMMSAGTVIEVDYAKKREYYSCCPRR